MKRHPNFLLLGLMVPVIAWSAWRPYDRLTWWLEVTPVFIGFIALFIAQAKTGWRFSNLAMLLIALHMIVLLVGGHYTYARVPAGAWASELMGWQRNHYDRLGHILQGLVPAIICREIFLRIRVIAHRGWLHFCVVSVCLAISATYELIEWAAALLSAEAAASFLGTQGDGWDTQWDMFLAGLGALIAVFLLARVHDRSIPLIFIKGQAFYQKRLAMWVVGVQGPGMRRARWLAEWRNSEQKPVFYHCISRVVDRRFVLGAEEKEKFRTLMRIYEKFSGCQVVSYCLMDNHFHLLLEVPPMAQGGLSDDELLRRLSALYGEAFVAEVAAELAEARLQVKEGRAQEAVVVRRIHERFTYRMHDLGEFMKGLLQRYTQWHNRMHSRTGRLWEDRFKSVIVEDGVAAKTIAAYIDLNPVRAGVVKDPAEYRWSSYGEAIGGGAKGNGKKARAGLVRALRAHQGCGADDALWTNDVSREYRKLLMAGAVERTETKIGRDGTEETRRTRKGMSAADAAREKERAGELSRGRMLRCRVRYFTDGAVIGSRSFVNVAFASARERFGKNRRDGARKLRGEASAAAGMLWSVRDLRKGI